MLLLLYLILRIGDGLCSAAVDDSWALSNDSLLWGPYRPNLYFGLQPRIANSLLTGLMWSNADDAPNTLQSMYRPEPAEIETLADHGQSKDLRHTCEQDEGMAAYGWRMYDVRNGGIQAINDTINRLDLITEFSKVSNNGKYGSWGLRVKGVPRIDAPRDQRTVVVFYLGNQDPESRTECMQGSADKSNNNGIGCAGSSPGLDNYRVLIPGQPVNDSSFLRTSVKSLTVPANTIWEAKSIFLDHLKDSGSSDSIIPNAPGEGNLHFTQQSFEGGFEFDILFNTEGEALPMTSASLTTGIETMLSHFSQRFQSVYFPRAPFRDAHHVEFSQSLLSNLMGGIGYFDGTSKVATSPALDDAEPRDNPQVKAAIVKSNVDVQEKGPYQLFSAVPSRPFFPRGFLWDEGFHLQVILDWDMDLALEIFLSWLDLMDEEGWIAREQILGPEARSKVPPEFQVQYQNYANPPTLFFIVRDFFARLSGNIAYVGAPSHYLSSSEAGKAFLMNAFAKLSTYHEWFRRTQAGNTSRYHVPGGDEHAEGYRWRGWTPEHILTCGLDDYPRAQPPHPEGLHLDALCWVGFMARILKDIAAFLGNDEISSDLSEREAAIASSMEVIHWSEADHAYCDAAISDDGQVERVCHKGYLSLYPFFLDLIRNETRLGAVLDLIHDSEELWSSHGLRSLSMNDQYYGKGENYWKGPIWININYMVLQSLLVSFPRFACTHIFFAQSETLELTNLSDMGSEAKLVSNESAHDIHRASIKSGQYCVYIVDGHKFCMGAIQLRKRQGSENAAFHWLDCTRRKDSCNARSLLGRQHSERLSEIHPLVCTKWYFWSANDDDHNSNANVTDRPYVQETTYTSAKAFDWNIEVSAT